MKNVNKTVLYILIGLSLVIFALYIIPNSRDSRNFAMVSMFEPDEGAIYTVADRMTMPANDWPSRLEHFFLYRFYHYGFPFFGLVGLFTLPVRLLGQFGNTPLLMTVLRQGINVLPSILAILLLVWMQDGFKSWRSIVLFLLLAMVPGVICNSFWVHPDGLVLLLSVCVLWQLWKDERRFGKHYYFAAAFCGVLIATKLVGFYFFLTIATLLVWQLIEKRFTFKQAFIKSILFIVVMGGAFLLANPFIFHFPSLKLYGGTILREIREISGGYGLAYKTGLRAALPGMVEHFGQVWFILLGLAANVLAIFRKEKRLLPVLTLTWFIPLSLMLVTVSHFKYQYWLPVALAMFSNLIFFFPRGKKEEAATAPVLPKIVQILFFGLIFVQAVLFVFQDVKIVQARLGREGSSPMIAFYERGLELLKPLEPYTENKVTYIYYDYRLYMPDHPRWAIETSFDMLQPGYVEDHDFDVMFLWNQRMRDYLNPNAQGVNADELATARVFYIAMKDDSIPGYQRLFADETGMIYVRDELCAQYFPGGTCR